MLQVKQVGQHDLDYKLHNLIFQHCINVQLPETVLSKYYSGVQLAEYIVAPQSEDYRFVLYEDTEPIGIFVLEEAYPVHLRCVCFVAQLLFIAEHKRSLKHLRALVLKTIHILQQYESALPKLIAVGSTVGSPILPSFYKRIGFIEAGTQLVLEL